MRDDEAGIITLEMDDNFISQFSKIDIFTNHISIATKLKEEEIVIDESDYNEFKYWSRSSSPLILPIAWQITSSL